ncbi:MAG: hypothetical protein JWN67_5046 [Actinomycetia bacterium]|nr:hypothetical protein [Actinomycetes bacterium]
MQQLLGGPRAGLDPDDVAAAFLLTVGTKLRHGVDVLNSSDVKLDVDLKFEAGSVAWAFRPPDDVTGVTNEVALVRRTASLTVVGLTSLFLEGYRYRPWTEILSPAGIWVRVNRGVFVATSPAVEDDGAVVRRRLTLAEKTHRLKRPLLEPLTVPAATNPVTYVTGSMTALFGETGFDIPATTVTTTGVKTWAADGTTWLQVYNQLLEVCAYDNLTVNEDTGRYRSVALADLAGRGPELIYGPGERKLVVPGSLEPLLPEIYNVARFVARKGPTLPTEGNGYRTKYNQSTGPSSIDRLGGDQRVVVVQVDAESQTQLDALASAQAQQYFAGGGWRFTGKVGINPLHGDRDVAGLVHPRLGVAADDTGWLVTGWSSPMPTEIKGPDDGLMPVVFEKKVVLT